MKNFVNNTCGLIVTYQPDFAVLRATISSLALNVDEILIYDNASNTADMSMQVLDAMDNVTVFYSNENIGIAEAQNLLLTEAISRGYKFAVMSDQDTVYPAQFVGTLIKYFDNAPKVAVVCPGWIDKNLGEAGKYTGQYVFKQCGVLKIDHRTDRAFKIAHAISSGMVIKLGLIDKIGLMRGDLFIDWVDNEWCWRINSLGFTVLGVPSVKIEHTLGDKTVSILGRNFVVRSSNRNYYIVRNALALMLSKSIPLAARIYLMKKVLHHSIFCLLASENKKSDLIVVIKAFWHGINGRLGQIR